MWVRIPNENGIGDKRGIGLLNKKTGKIEKQVRLGGINADFRLDTIESKLFHLKGKKHLVAYDLTK